MEENNEYGDKIPNLPPVLQGDINEMYWEALKPNTDHQNVFYVYNKANGIEIKILGKTPLDAAANAVKAKFVYSSPINFTDIFYVDERGFRTKNAAHKFATQEVFAEADFDIDGGTIACV
jgi:hypothetical protein